VTKVLVLGGGPAGYVAALRVAQLGAAVTVVEAREIGGTCLNRGCIPTKAMVAGAERLAQAREAAEFGVLTGDVRLDFDAFRRRKERVTAQLRGGVEQLLKARKVEIVAGIATLAGPGRLALDDGSVLEGDAVILASGSEPARLPVFSWGDERVMTSDDLLAIDHVPASLAIVGGGVIGCEFASIFARLGSKVTVIELLDQLLPEEDKRTGRTLQQAFKKAGVEVIVKTAVEGVVDEGADSPGAHRPLSLRLADGRTVAADRVLVSVGRKAVSRGFGYEEAGVEIDGRGFVVTDETQRTMLDGVFAAGDVAGPPQLAHWAYHQGEVAAENAVTGGAATVDCRFVPNCVFSAPEVASFGLTEDRAAAQGRAVEVAHVRFNGNSRAVIAGEPDGYVRIVCEPGGGPVLGASLVGPHVTELVHELVLAAKAGVSVEQIAATIHAHPTLSEGIGEAAANLLGKGVHSL
jgi:dihydrolipoamide dehydrogenase